MKAALRGQSNRACCDTVAASLVISAMPLRTDSLSSSRSRCACSSIASLAASVSSAAHEVHQWGRSLAEARACRTSEGLVAGLRALARLASFASLIAPRSAQSSAVVGPG